MIRNILSRRADLVLVALISTALFTGCGIFNPPEKDDPPPPVVHDRTTPARLIDFFAWQQADPQRNLEEYTRCLDPSYQFYFTAVDLAADPTLPDFWTKENDVNSTQGMFSAAISITVSILPEGASSSGPCDTGDPTGRQCIKQPVRVNMAVEIPHPPDPDNLTLLVGGLADFYIVKDPVDTTLYVIYQIYDRTNELGRYGAAPIAPILSNGSPVLPAEVPIEPMSWGRVRKQLAELGD